MGQKRVAELERAAKRPATNATNAFAAVSDQVAIRRVAELLVRELPQGQDAHERQKTQRQLLGCLHPDKCPASRTATSLMQEVQENRSWIPVKTLGESRGGA